MAVFLLPAAVEAAGPYSFYAVVPCRLVDTRSGAAITHGEVRHFTIVNQCGIPLDAKAAALNFVIVGPTTGGHLVTFPYNPSNPNAAPDTSTLNWNAGESAIANGQSLQMTSSTYNISAMPVVPGGSTHLIIDVTGYFK